MVFCDNCGNPLPSTDAPCPVCARNPATEELVIGKEPYCDLVLQAPNVSGRHVCITRLAGGAVRITDLGSTNGTFINGQRLTPNEPVLFDELPTIFLGSLPLLPATVERAFAFKKETAKQPLPDDGQWRVLGRDPACDEVFAHPVVSARHARIRKISDTSWEVVDLKSANGTYVNGNRIRSAVLKPGDRLFLGSVEVLWETWNRRKKAAHPAGVHLSARELTQVEIDHTTGKPICILNDVSVSLFPGEFVAVMGPSGSGKTTLFEMLNGYKPPTKGSVQLGGIDLYAHWDQLKESIGYVPQDDIIYPDLTVFESLYYTARLRLPSDTTDAEIGARIDRVLRDLDLVEKKHTRIGGPGDRTLSGGQRKRVNIAQELLTEPPVLFLDEPTSGLSAQDALGVVRVLKSIAETGRLVIVSIHSPTERIFSLFDQVLILKEGCLAYFGPVDRCFAFFQTQAPDPTEVMDKLAARSGAQWKDLYERSHLYQEYVRHRLAESAAAPSSHRRTVSMTVAQQWAQFCTLARRYLKLKWASTFFRSILILEPIVISLFTASVFYESRTNELQRNTPLFIMVVAAIFFGCFNASLEIVSERTIFRRERMVNLRLWTYLASKFVWLSAFGVVQVTVFSLILAGILDFQASKLWMILILSILNMASGAVGLLISAFFKKSEYALMVVPLVLIPQIVLGGTLVPLSQWRTGAAALTVSRWATESLFDQEAKAIEQRPIKKSKTPTDVAGQAPPGPKPSQMWLEPFHLKSGKTARNLAVIGFHGLIYLLLAGFLLRWKA